MASGKFCYRNFLKNEIESRLTMSALCVERMVMLLIAEGYVMVPEDGVYYVSSRADQVWIDSKLLIDNSSEVKSISHRDNCVALAKLYVIPIKYVFIANITGGWPSWWNGLNLQMRKDNSKEFADVEDSQLFH